MAVNLLNVELTDQLVKVSFVKKKGKALDVVDSFQFQPPKGVLLDGQVLDAEALAQQLRAHLPERRMDTLRTPSSKVVSREAVLPPVKERRLGNLVQINAAEYFPLDLTNYKLTHSVIERIKGEEPGWRVMITAAPKPLLLSYAKLADAMRMELEAIDHVANSQYQMIKTLNKGEGVTMFANVGVRQTVLSFMQGGGLLLQRSFPFGGGDLLNAAMDAAQMEDERFAEAIGLCEDEEWLCQNLNALQRKEGYERLVNGLARSGDFFKSGRRGAGVERVVLFGTCAQFFGLREAIAQDMDLEVQHFAALPEAAQWNKTPGGISNYLATIGAAIAPLDLIYEAQKSGERAKKTKKESSILLGILVLVLSLTSGLSLVVPAYLDLRSVEQELAQTNERIAQLATVEQIYNEYRAYQVQREEFVMLEQQSAGAPNASLRAFFEELEQKMPQSVLALSATCDSVGVIMNIQAASMEAVAVTLAQLRSFESIQDLSIGTVAEATDELGLQSVTVSVSCYYAASQEDGQEGGQ